MSDLDSLRALIKDSGITLVTAVQVCNTHRAPHGSVSWDPVIVTIDYANILST